MDVEIVLDEYDGRRVREVDVGQVLEDMGIVDGGVAVRHLDVAPAFERREQHEQVGGAVALVLVSTRAARPGFIGIGTRVSAMSCLEVSSKQTSGRAGSCGRV